MSNKTATRPRFVYCYGVKPLIAGLSYSWLSLEPYFAKLRTLARVNFNFRTNLAISVLQSGPIHIHTHTRTDISHIHTHTQKDISHIHTNRHLTHTHTNRNLTHTQTDISHTHTHTDISHTFTLSKLISTVGLTVKPDRLTRGLGGEGYR